MSHIRPGRSSAATSSALVAVAVLSLIAVALSGYLWVVSARLHAEGLAGPLAMCPETDLISCGEVLASRYSQWLRVPLAGIGTANYVLLLATAVGLLVSGLRQPRLSLWTAGLALAGLGTLCGVWLLLVQIFLIHRFCLLCDLTHLCGLISLILLGVYRPANLPTGLRTGAWGLALAGAMGLVLGQVIYTPGVIPTKIVIQPSGTQPTGVAGAGTQLASDTRPAAGPLPASALIPAVRPANAFDITDSVGTVVATLDLANEIILGDPKAEKTIVEFMDFGCHECRQEFELMQQVWEKHPHWFRIVVLLFPGNKECNPHTGRDRPNVCEVAQAALAIRKHGPEHYVQAHRMFFQLQDTPLTGGMAWQLIKQMCNIEDSALEAWQADPTLLEKIKQHSEIVNAMVKGQQINKTVGLPGLFANGKLITGASQSVSQLEGHLTQLIGPPGEEKAMGDRG